MWLPVSIVGGAGFLSRVLFIYKRDTTVKNLPMFVSTSHGIVISVKYEL